MIKFISKRTSLLLLVSMLIGLIFFTIARRATAQGEDTFDYRCDEWEDCYDDGSGMYGGNGGWYGGSGGGVGTPYCAVPEVSIEGGGTCKATGCRLAPNYHNTYICDYKKVGTGTSKGCPPLETCQ